MDIQDQKQTHKNYWSKNDNYKRFQNVLINITTKNGIKIGFIHDEAKKALQNLKSPGVFNPKTLRLYLKKIEGSFRNNSHHLSAVLYGLNESIDSIDLDEITSKKLKEFYDEFDDAGLSNIFSNISESIRQPFLNDTSNLYKVGDIKKILKGMRVSKPPKQRTIPIYPPFSPGNISTPITKYENDLGLNIWIKDESYNFTGSHKDRWALEQLAFLREIIENDIVGKEDSDYCVVPRFSIISAGSAAVALQVLLKLHSLPPLKAILDPQRVEPEIIFALESIGTEVYKYNLEKEELDSESVLTITKNVEGIDITSRDYRTPGERNYYDWLVCEVLTHEGKPPTHIFVPYGTGELYSNILHILEFNQPPNRRDPRLRQIGDSILSNIGLYGVTTNNPSSDMDKLYSKYRPTFDTVKQKVGKLIKGKVLKKNSGIYTIDDRSADFALKQAETQNFRSEMSGIAGLGLCLEKYIDFDISSEDKLLVINTGWFHTAY